MGKSLTPKIDAASDENFLTNCDSKTTVDNKHCDRISSKSLNNCQEGQQKEDIKIEKSEERGKLKDKVKNKNLCKIIHKTLLPNYYSEQNAYYFLW